MIRTLNRLSLVAIAAVVAQMAGAAINYNVLQATIAYNNGDTQTLTFLQNGDAISFTPSSPAIVGGGGDPGHLAATVTIIYTAESDTSVNGLNLDFSGAVTNLGQVSFSEIVEHWSPSGGAGSVIASVNGGHGGAGLAGGADGAFTDSELLSFSDPVFSYKVKKTFTLLDLDSSPENSSAQLTSVDQSPVPEPTTMAALAVGGVGLLMRRRKK